MSDTLLTPGKVQKISPRMLWVAVGGLAATSLALAAVLVQDNRHDDSMRPVGAPTQRVAKTADVVTTPVSKTTPDSSAKAVHAHTANTTKAHTSTAAAPSASGSFSEPAAASPATVCASCGTVEAVTPLQRDAAQGSGAGAVAGAVLGGLVGNQFGGGDGKTLATLAGAVGGGYAGNAVEKKMKKVTVYRVEVRMANGATRTFEQSSPATVGAQVRVEGNALKPA